MKVKEIQQKINQCKALQGKTVADIVEMQRFQMNLTKYFTAQKEDRKAIRSSYLAMQKLGGSKGYKLPAHAIDKVMDWSVEDLAVEYLRIFDKQSKESAAVRKYIFQLAGQAYNLTIAQIVCEEFPELESVFFPKSKKN